MGRVPAVEWPTLALIALSYAVWALGTTWAAALFLPLGMVMVALAAALHSSLCHEVLHGHPTRHRWLNELLVFPQLTLLIPYGRFRDTHIEHHRDERLTELRAGEAADPERPGRGSRVRRQRQCRDSGRPGLRGGPDIRRAVRPERHEWDRRERDPLSDRGRGGRLERLEPVLGRDARQGQ